LDGVVENQLRAISEKCLEDEKEILRLTQSQVEEDSYAIFTAILDDTISK